MLNLFLRVFSFLDKNFLTKAIKKTFSKLPLVNPTKKLLARTPRKLRNLAFISRVGVGDVIQYKLEEKYAFYMIKRISKMVNLTKSRILLTDNLLLTAKKTWPKLNLGMKRAFVSQILSERRINRRLFIRDAKKSILISKFYRFFTKDYKNFKLVKGRDDKLIGYGYNQGLFTNSSWLVGYKRGEPNGMLFTKNSSFTVPGLTDNMIDRMLVAPDAGKYLWNTLWLPRRGRKPENVIRSLFSGAFKKEYAKRKQAFKRG